MQRWEWAKTFKTFPKCWEFSPLFTFRRFWFKELCMNAKNMNTHSHWRSKFQLNIIKVILPQTHTCSSQLVISSMVSCCAADGRYMQFSFQLFSLWWDFQNILQIWRKDFAESFMAELSKVLLLNDKSAGHSLVINYTHYTH